MLYLVGAVDSSILFEMIEAISKKDATKVLALCEEVNRQGRSLRQFVGDLVEHSRNLLVAKTTKGGVEVLDYSAEYVEALKQQADFISTNEIMLYMKHLSTLEYDMRTSVSPRILLEVALLKLVEVQMDSSPEAMVTKVQLLEEKLEQLMKNGLAVAAPAPVVETVSRKEIVPHKLPEAVAEEVKHLKDKWPQIISSLGTTSAARTVYATAEAGYIEGDIFYIVHRKGMEAGVNKYLDEVKGVINQVAGKNVKVRTISAEEYANKSIETYGSSPEISPEVQDISQVLRNVQSKINFNIEVK